MLGLDCSERLPASKASAYTTTCANKRGRVLACFNPQWPNLNFAVACFDLGQDQLPTKAQTNWMADLIIFRCPYTGMNVQTDLLKQEVKGGERHYEMIECPACMKLHFINREDGRTLGHDK
jgi:hypothetical protein